MVTGNSLSDVESKLKEARTILREIRPHMAGLGKLQFHIDEALREVNVKKELQSDNWVFL